MNYAVYIDEFVYKVGPEEYHDVGYRVDIGKRNYQKDRNPLFVTRAEAEEYVKLKKRDSGTSKLKLMPVAKKSTFRSKSYQKTN